MTPAPGQGFRAGLDIQFIAIPFPLPDDSRADLIAAGNRAMAARKAVDICKEGESHKRAKYEHLHQEALSSLELLEISTRHAIGVVHTRPSFTSLSEKR